MLVLLSKITDVQTDINELTKALQKTDTLVVQCIANYETLHVSKIFECIKIMAL